MVKILESSLEYGNEAEGQNSSANRDVSSKDSERKKRIGWAVVAVATCGVLAGLVNLIVDDSAKRQAAREAREAAEETELEARKGVLDGLVMDLEGDNLSIHVADTIETVWDNDATLAVKFGHCATEIDVMFINQENSLVQGTWQLKTSDDEKNTHLAIYGPNDQVQGYHTLTNSGLVQGFNPECADEF